MASAPQAHLCRAVGAAPLPLAQRRAAIAHILAQPGSAADPPVLAALAVEWVQSGNDVLAADLLNHIAAKSHALPSIASLLDRKPPLAVPHLLTVFLHLFSAREKANTGSSLADQCTVSEGLGPILNDSKLAPEAQAALARLLLHHPACRPTGVDLITRATIWLTLVQLDTQYVATLICNGSLTPDPQASTSTPTRSSPSLCPNGATAWRRSWWRSTVSLLSWPQKTPRRLPRSPSSSRPSPLASYRSPQSTHATVHTPKCRHRSD